MWGIMANEGSGLHIVHSFLIMNSLKATILPLPCLPGEEKKMTIIFFFHVFNDQNKTLFTSHDPVSLTSWTDITIA